MLTYSPQHDKNSTLFDYNETKGGFTMNHESHRFGRIVSAFLLCSLILAPAAFATNGMNMEGYGPIATGMGGASMAYDNGTAALMNNPATLGLMSQGSRLDAAFGLLGPNITSKATGAPDAESSADMFFMPAFGWALKSGQFTYGAGVFAQGGMGTEYSGSSFLAAGSGDPVMSQVSVGRFLVPLAYEVDKNLSIGATLDFVWATMDLRMALDNASFQNMVAGFQGSQTLGTASGSMVDTLVGAFTVPQTMCGDVPCLSSLDWARFDFADESDFTGKAKGTGLAAKLGGVYKVNSELSVGAAYHSKTAISDLEANGATVSMQVSGPGVMGGPVVIPVRGNITVEDFQWPQMIGAGMAYQVSDKLLVVFDYKWINWKDVMKDFKMTFTADVNQYDNWASAFQLGGQTLNATLYQNWKDQNVFMLGAGYKVTDQFTARAGLNIANNPVPDEYMNALFPAIIKTHITLGAGYDIDTTSAVNASITYAPEVKAENANTGITTTHSQNNAQIMYSYRF